MLRLEKWLDELLLAGRLSFLKQEALEGMGLASTNFNAAAAKLLAKGVLAKPRRGFFVIVRPEDRVAGPDPVLWIDALMAFLNLDYRVSLLRAAAFHGSSHQAGMVFQVVVPQQLPRLEIGRRRVEFVYQGGGAFELVNRPDWYDQMKGDAGFVKVAGLELTLLDCVKYVNRSGGLHNVAQIVKDLGGKVSPRTLRQAARAYGPSVSCRLGYLLEWSGHSRQAEGLAEAVLGMKSYKPLLTGVMDDVEILSGEVFRDERWRLLINETPEVEG